jgi:enoyl-CoA hydratase
VEFFFVRHGNMSLFCPQLAARRAVFSSHKFGFSTSIRFMSAFAKSYENILTSRPESSVALVTLNRPKALNTLNTALFAELNDALHLIDADREIGAIVITGSERAFAGAYEHHHTLASNERTLTGCRTGGFV